MKVLNKIQGAFDTGSFRRIRKPTRLTFARTQTMNSFAVPSLCCNVTIDERKTCAVTSLAPVEGQSSLPRNQNADDSQKSSEK